MYFADRATVAKAASREGARWRRVTRNVWYLGLTSLFTDISSEMVASILPLYLVVGLGLTPFAFGIVDGLYQGIAALLRVVGGILADRTRRHKEIAAVGYAVSVASRLGMLAAGTSWPALAGVVVLDRTAKGVRTAPRDALLSLSSPREDLGLSFGVHRAMDAFGAMLGPMVAFLILARAPGAFDAVFVASFCVGVIGLAVLLLYVENATPNHVTAEPRTLQIPRASLSSTLRLAIEPRFRAIVLGGSALALATISDSFIYLGLQRQVGFQVTFFPLLYVGTALFYFLLSAPAGRLADRYGRGLVFVGGYALLAAVYIGVLLDWPSAAGAIVCLALLGGYYAATDGVLMALASGVLAPEMRGSGLALLTTVTNLARLAASILFGIIWSWLGLQPAVITFTLALMAAIVITGIALRRQTGDLTHD